MNFPGMYDDAIYCARLLCNPLIMYRISFQNVTYWPQLIGK
jgi:hypothetical protein